VTRFAGAGVALMVLAAPALHAQGQVKSAVYFERYTFDSLAVSALSELTIPITVTAELGRWGRLLVTGGYVSVDLKSRDPQGEDRTISGALDTEARVTIDLVPERLMLLLNGAIPTGIKSVNAPELSALTLVAEDIIGFTASELGTGGYVGSGLVGAFPAGRMAVGIAATYRLPFSYEPIKGAASGGQFGALQPGSTLRPGNEFRLRVGLEGPLGPRTYLRTAGIFAVRQSDAINDATVSGVGNRLTGYVSLNQAIGGSSATFYAFDVFRGNPQIEPNAIGTGFLPRGNLFVVGTQWAFRLSASAELTPQLEYRLSHAAPDTVTNSLERAGSSFRVGANLRRQLSQRVGLVIHASALTGKIRQVAGVPTDSDVSGFRGAVHLEVRH